MLRLALIAILAASVGASTEDAVRHAVEQLAAARAPGATLRVEVVRVSDGITPPVTVSLPDGTVIPRGRLQVRVKGADGSAGYAMVHVAHFDSVATPTRRLSSGEPVTPDDLRFVLVETTRFSGDPLTPSSLRAMASHALISQRTLTAERPLRTSDIGPRPAAETGDPVVMRYARGAFVFDISCRARDRGQIGDVIRLYSDDSDTAYRARLVAPGHAEWIETL